MGRMRREAQVSLIEKTEVTGDDPEVERERIKGWLPYLILDTFSVSRLVSVSCRFIVRRRVKTACEREELGYWFK